MTNETTATMNANTAIHQSDAGRKTEDLIHDGLEVELDTDDLSPTRQGCLEGTIELIETFGLQNVLVALRAAAEGAYDVHYGRDSIATVAGNLREVIDGLDRAAKAVQ